MNSYLIDNYLIDNDLQKETLGTKLAEENTYIIQNYKKEIEESTGETNLIDLSDPEKEKKNELNTSSINKINPLDNLSETQKSNGNTLIDPNALLSQQIIQPTKSLDQYHKETNKIEVKESGNLNPSTDKNDQINRFEEAKAFTTNTNYKQSQVNTEKKDFFDTPAAIQTAPQIVEQSQIDKLKGFINENISKIKKLEKYIIDNNNNNNNNINTTDTIWIEYEDENQNNLEKDAETHKLQNHRMKDLDQKTNLLLIRGTQEVDEAMAYFIEAKRNIEKETNQNNNAVSSGAFNTNNKIKRTHSTSSTSSTLSLNSSSEIGDMQNQRHNSSS